MTKNNKVKKLLITLIVVMVAVMLKSTFVQATEVTFSGWTKGTSNLWDSHKYYCTEHRRLVSWWNL